MMLIVCFEQRPDGTIAQTTNKTYKTWRGLESNLPGFGGSDLVLIEDRGTLRKYQGFNLTIVAIDVLKHCEDLFAEGN